MILVVDDDHTILKLVRELLEGEGFEVCTAHDGASSYKLLRNANCKGMLLDLLMPGINGAELLMLMQAEGVHLPVVIMAGSPDFDEAEMKQFSNVKRLLHKPFYPEDLLAAVREYMPRKK
jgi:DNA-binding response OmpR family regulator